MSCGPLHGITAAFTRPTPGMARSSGEALWTSAVKSPDDTLDQRVERWSPIHPTSGAPSLKGFLSIPGTAHARDISTLAHVAGRHPDPRTIDAPRHRVQAVGARTS